MVKFIRTTRIRCAYFTLAMAGAAVLGGLLLTGCGSGSSAAGHIMQEYPWLAPLGLSFIQGLLAEYGSNLVALLIAAAAALVG
jgi:hypothetical protein